MTKPLAFISPFFIFMAVTGCGDDAAPSSSDDASDAGGGGVGGTATGDGGDGGDVPGPPPPGRDCPLGGLKLDPVTFFDVVQGSYPMTAEDACGDWTLGQPYTLTVLASSLQVTVTSDSGELTRGWDALSLACELTHNGDTSWVLTVGDGTTLITAGFVPNSATLMGASVWLGGAMFCDFRP